MAILAPRKEKEKNGSLLVNSRFMVGEREKENVPSFFPFLNCPLFSSLNHKKDPFLSLSLSSCPEVMIKWERERERKEAVLKQWRRAIRRLPPWGKYLREKERERENKRGEKVRGANLVHDHNRVKRTHFVAEHLKNRFYSYQILNMTGAVERISVFLFLNFVFGFPFCLILQLFHFLIIWCSVGQVNSTENKE